MRDGPPRALSAGWPQPTNGAHAAHRLHRKIQRRAQGTRTGRAGASRSIAAMTIVIDPAPSVPDAPRDLPRDRGTELSSRESSGGRLRIRAARFPAHKTLEEFDFTFQRSVKKTVIEHLGQLDFLHGKQNVILLGSPDPVSHCPLRVRHLKPLQP